MIGDAALLRYCCRVLKPTGEAAFHSMSTIEELAGPTHAAILVVEDEDLLRQAVAKTLRMNGFDIFEAADGSLAIDLFARTGTRLMRFCRT
jgi:hypothetical protein